MTTTEVLRPHVTRHAAYAPPGRQQHRRSAESARPVVRGKFLFAGDEKLYVRGVSYGAFRPDANGREYTDARRLHHDFAMMAANGINTVRIPHTMPPRELLDIAHEHGLRVMVGLSAEQYVGYLMDGRGGPDVEAEVRAKVRSCAGHPALLCYALGNEIPASVARWLGRERIERYLERLYHAVKAEDPEGLVTYVNYPTTEYLQLPFLDLVAFNVYLEERGRLDAYLAKLHNIAGERPLLMSELGLDALRNGETEQARSLEWQVRTSFASGCVGVVVFSWTDEWYRGGAEVDDWEFGLTDRERRPKPALAAVRQAFGEVPFPPDAAWPRVSVVVCSRNGSRTIHETLDALSRLTYPGYEVIVVDDGSTDGTAAIARTHGFPVISTGGCGLSAARNAGLAAATGSVIAYTDDDAYPDPDWLHYLVWTLNSGRYAGVGGWNISPAGDGRIADCVANAPGGPIHVLLSDTVAEHIPGCNMAFDVDRLRAVGGFDAQFRTAGDDVDVCWRLQACGWELGFSPAALVWHHRRNSLRAFWRQQRGYGRAEALLERKWPQKYNGAGHVSWGGRVYGKGLFHLPTWRRGRIYQGSWGLAPFQSLYQPSPGGLSALALMPEWYLVLGALAGISVLGALWRPLLWAVPLLLVAAMFPVTQAILGGARARFATRYPSRVAVLALRALTSALYLVQPLARLWGRQQHGLTPWRPHGSRSLVVPRPRRRAVWCERWQPPEAWLVAVQSALAGPRIRMVQGGDFDRWDIEVRGGMHGGARLLMAFEDNGGGSQYVRAWTWPRFSWAAIAAAGVLGVLATLAGVSGVSSAAVLLVGAALLLVTRTVHECVSAQSALEAALDRLLRRDA